MGTGVPAMASERAITSVSCVTCSLHEYQR